MGPCLAGATTARRNFFVVLFLLSYLCRNEKNLINLISYVNFFCYRIQCWHIGNMGDVEHSKVCNYILLTSFLIFNICPTKCKLHARKKYFYFIFIICYELIDLCG